MHETEMSLGSTGTDARGEWEQVGCLSLGELAHELSPSTRCWERGREGISDCWVGQG